MSRALAAAMAAHPAGKALGCDHKPGTVVELDAECIWSTCRGCGVPIWKLYEPGGEDTPRRPGWGRWRAAPTPRP